MSTPLIKIKKSGFVVALLDDGKFTVEPASALTQRQRQFLKGHKAEIVRELKIERMKQPGDKSKVLNWLAHIGETDHEIVEDTLRRCRADWKTMEYFLKRSDEITRTEGQSK